VRAIDPEFLISQKIMQALKFHAQRPLIGALYVDI
jgi:hypothetical protein